MYLRVPRGEGCGLTHLHAPPAVPGRDQVSRDVGEASPLPLPISHWALPESGVPSPPSCKAWRLNQ